MMFFTLPQLEHMLHFVLEAMQHRTDCSIRLTQRPCVNARWTSVTFVTATS
jgi:hypothetical protein